MRHDGSGRAEIEARELAATQAADAHVREASALIMGVAGARRMIV